MHGRATRYEANRDPAYAVIDAFTPARAGNVPIYGDRSQDGHSLKRNEDECRARTDGYRARLRKETDGTTSTAVVAGRSV